MTTEEILKVEDIEKLQSMIDKGADLSKVSLVEVMNKEEKPNINLVKILIDSGVDVNTKDDGGATALMVACHLKEIEIVRLLLNNGADVNLQMKAGNTALGIVCINKNVDIDIVELLIDNGADVNLQDNTGGTSLKSVCLNGSVDVVKLLISNDADINIKNKEGDTALTTACTHNFIEVVKLLINNDADVNSRDKEGYTALMTACSGGNIEVVRLLIDNGADMNIQDHKGRTALSCTLDNPGILKGFSDNYKDIVTLLVEKGADVNANPLTLGLACVHGDVKTVQLLTDNGADVNGMTNDNLNVLLFACMSGDIEIIEHLIELGADVNAKIQDGTSLLAVILLISKKLFKLISPELNTDVMFSNFESKREDISRLLITNGANINYGIEDMSILKMCAIKPEILAEYVGRTIQEKEASGVLINSMNFGDIEMAKFLIKNGADINIQDSQGVTPLIIACSINNIEMVQLLIDSQADVNIEDNEGYNAYTYGKKYKEITRLLIRNGINTTPKIYSKFLNMPKDEQKNSIDELVKKKQESIKVSKKHIHSLIKKYPKSKMTEILESKDLEQLKDLIDTGYDTSFVDLFDLIKEDYPVEFIRLIIKCGANVNVVHKKAGLTPLIVATMLNKVEIVKLLINNGADVEWKTKEGEEAFNYAKNHEIINILLNPAEYQTNLHRPKDLVHILTNFRKDTPIKYTTHDWDMDFKDEYDGNFKVFLTRVEKDWNKIEKDLHELSPRLHKKIYNFLINTDCESWCSKEGDDISIGWSSLDGLEEWCNEGNDPFKFKLDKTYKIDNKTITTFGEVIKLFKQEIQVRRENDMLENIFIDIEEQLDEEFDGLFVIDVIKLKKKQFYTNVEVFKNVLNIIFSEMKENKSHPNIKVEICEDPDDIYYDLKIIQIGSESGISAKSISKIADGGSSSSIKNSLLNLCDWSIESSHEGDNYRINYLKSNTKKDMEHLPYKPEGFTHILRFYK